MRDPRSPFPFAGTFDQQPSATKNEKQKIFKTNATKEKNPQTTPLIPIDRKFFATNATKEKISKIAPLIPITGKFFTTNATKENQTKTRAPFFQYCQS